jgi:alanyl-tRNA synthetase
MTQTAPGTPRRTRRTASSRTAPHQPLTSAEIAARYLAFFRARDHREIAGSSLVLPGNSTSFVIAGMQPLLPYLRGQEPPPAPRLTALQLCLRTDDAEAVGRNGRKLTSFHMLGNWSIGDYGKREAITLARALLDEFGIARDGYWVTTFAGDAALGLPPDAETVAEWRRAGMPAERIVPLGMDDNFWPAGGWAGPCGPCSEIFVDRGAALGCGRPTCQPGCSCERFLEIWNLVFIEYDQSADGRFAPLPLRSVDTGMGLERMAAVLQGAATVFETDLFAPARRRLAELAPVEPDGEGERRVRARRVIVDHTRAALFAGLAGVRPGRDGRASVVRRLIRRAARQGRLLGLEGPFLAELAEPILEGHAGLVAEGAREQLPALAGMVREEEEQFARVLTSGLRRLARLAPDGRGLVAGEQVFALHADRGFPADLAGEVLAERGLAVDWAGYEAALARHQEVSRASMERRFGGG